jgi:hypothetical protein
MQTTTFPGPGMNKNPLASFMRQPKIYIKLPSQGNYWPIKSIDMPENGELPVFSMTARDELMFKTPDALLNGQAVVDVIQSCMPNIKNAWDLPTIDLDTILIAIRLATYGEKMTIKHKIPVVNEDVEYEVDLRNLLDQQSQNTWMDQVVIGPDLIVFVKPLTYRHMTQTSLKSFETTRILNIVNDENISDEKKLEMFSSSFSTLTKITVDLMAESIYKIVTAEEEVTDKKFILEFVNNVDKSIFDQVNNHLGELKKINELKPLICSTTEEQQTAGAPATYSVPISFNESDFFAKGF